MAERKSTTWDAAGVRVWLDARIAAARADQVVAERGGRARQDDCDQANAEEMVCTLLRKAVTDDPATFIAAVQVLLDRDEHIWRGVYDDTRFDRHVRTHLRKIARMAKTGTGFDRTGHYQ